MLEPHLVQGLALCVGLWIWGFSLNAWMLSRGMALHGSYTSSLILALRQLILAAICLLIWRRWFPQRYTKQL
jgi:hypothetical protein